MPNNPKYVMKMLAKRLLGMVYVCHGGCDQGGEEPAVVQDSFGEVKEVVSDLTGRAAT